MPLQTHLQRRGAAYHFRVRIPQDIAGKTALRELRFSLLTNSAPIARRRCQAGRLALTRCFDELRRMIQENVENPTYFLTNKQIRELARSYFLQEISRDEIFRANIEEFGGELQERQLARPVEEQELRRALGGGQLELGHDTADQILAYHGINPSFEGETREIPASMFNQLCFVLLRARLAANLLAQAHDRGDFGAIPDDPIFKDITSTDFNLADDALVRAVVGRVDAPARLTERQSTPMSEVWKLVVAEKKNLKDKTVGDYENASKWLIQVIGDKPVARVSEDELLTFKDTLMKTPSNFTKKLKTDNILEAIKRNADLPTPHPVMAANTVNLKYLGALREIFTWAKENNYTIGKENPATEVKLKTVKSTGSTKVKFPFTIPQLVQIFDTPLYQGAKSKKRLFEVGGVQVRNFRFWVPLLALFSGCRLNELGQLEFGDIVEFHGMPHLHVRTERDPEDQEDEALIIDAAGDRSIKSPSARRRVPLHQELIRIGFLNFVEDRRESNQRKASLRLFPEWSRAADGYYSSNFSKWFNSQYLEKIGVKTRHLSFHSLRHNFKDAMRNAGIASETQHRYMGHKIKHVSSEYGDGELVRAQSEEMNKLSYEGLDLSFLHHANPLMSVIKVFETREAMI